MNLGQPLIYILLYIHSKSYVQFTKSGKNFLHFKKVTTKTNRLFYGYNNGGKSSLANAKPFPLYYNVVNTIAKNRARAARVLACSGARGTDHAEHKAEKLPRPRSHPRNYLVNLRVFSSYFPRFFAYLSQ